MDPQTRYEEVLEQFIQGIFQNQPFLAGVEALVREIRGAGRINSLAQTLLKITTPGVPDIYQGCELWDLSLVDPDNRRPVDYEVRRKLAGELAGLSVDHVMARSDEGLPKLWLIWRALNVRRSHPEWLGGTADYLPLAIKGAKSRHATAFLRADSVAVVVPRFPLTLAQQWEDTSVELPAGRWSNELTGDTCDGGRQALTTLLARFPTGLLTKIG
jgi:(1->4)-alpha-D-glucan 1-alpha-D-glucosylmutase